MVLFLFFHIFQYNPDKVVIDGGEVFYKGLKNYGEIGAPSLPYETVLLPIPSGVKVDDIRVSISDSVILRVDFIPQRVRPPKGEIDIPMPDVLPEVYPDVQVRFQSLTFRGLGLLQLMVSPIRYDHNRLILYKRIAVEPRFCPSQVKMPERMGPISLKITRRIYYDLTKTTPPLPPVDGEDLLVVTPERFLDLALRYAELKRKKGLLTRVVTAESLINSHPAPDPAAAIRLGITDLYHRYGFIFLTLIGDPSILPVRRFHWFYEACQMGRDVPTDFYYSCLDGNWNKDHDSYYGEFEDSIDLFPEVYVGRISIKNDKEGSSYLDKLTEMTWQPDTDINNRIIFFASSLFKSGDGLLAAESIAARIPDTLNPEIVILHDTIPGLLNKKIAFDSIRAGFRIVFGIGHGNPTRFQYDGNYAERPDYDTLKNPGRTGLFYHITCSNNSFETDCIGEHITNNRYGGCLNFIGPAWVSFLYPHTYLAEEIVQYLPKHPVGISLSLSYISFIPQIQSDPIFRLIALGTGLLGDPTISYPLKPHVPITSFNHPDTLLTGIYQIDIDYTPMELARISFLGGDCHKTITANGNATLETYARKPGLGFLTLSRPGEPVIEDTLVIKPAGCHLGVGDFRYEPGRPNPFEEGSLSVLIQNTGIVPSPSGLALLTTSNPEVNIKVGSVPIPSLNPGDSIWTSPFVFDLFNLNDNDEVRLAITIVSSIPEFYDTISLFIAAPVVMRLKNLIRDEDGDGRIERNENFLLDFLFYNKGGEKSDSHILKIDCDPQFVILRIDSLMMPPIPPGDKFVIGHFSGRATDRWHPEVEFRLEIDSVIERFELDPPSPPEPDYAFSTDSGITILWDWPQSGDGSGFYIYRDDGSGNLKMLNIEPITVGRYTDTVTGSYTYYVSCLDTSRNESRLSREIFAQAIPLHPGFPAPLSYYNFSSPKIADIDPDYPGLEIIQGMWDGKLYLYHENGAGGLFAILDGAIWATPAIGDVDHDGELDVVIGTRKNQGKVYVLDRFGNPKPGFPITVDGQVLSSISISDLDQDQRLEMTLVTTRGIFYILDDDGTTIFTKDLGGYHWGTPAIGDIDGDSVLEIIPPTGCDTVYVFEGDGSIQPPFPVTIPANFFYGPTLANLDLDPNLEIALGTVQNGLDQILLLDDDGSVMTGWPRSYEQNNVDDHVAFGDIDLDGHLDVVFDYQIAAWTGGITVLNSQGDSIQGWPRLRGEGSSNPIIVDVNGDGRLDIICGSADRKIYGYLYDGNYLPGFPIQTGHTIYTTPAVADVNGDGRLELAIAALDWKLYLFDLPWNYNPSGMVWPCFRSDLYNTGCYREPEVAVNLVDTRIRPILSMIPVPARSPLSFNYQTNVPFEIKVFDPLGRVLRSEKIKGRGRFVVDLPSGIYFIRVIGSDFQMNKKVVLIR